jgi:hypothetical protein
LSESPRVWKLADDLFCVLVDRGEAGSPAKSENKFQLRTVFFGLGQRAKEVFNDKKTVRLFQHTILSRKEGKSKS